MKPQPRRKPLPKTLPDWVRHVTDTIRMVEECAYERFGRWEIGYTLQVGSTTAKKILARMGAEKTGGAYSISKPQLLRELRKIAGNPMYSAMVDREEMKRTRIESLRPTRGGHAKLLVTQPEREQIERMTVSALPAGIYISQGTIWLTVENWNDYLAKLGALIHATDNDRDTIERLITQSVP